METAKRAKKICKHAAVNDHDFNAIFVFLAKHKKKYVVLSEGLNGR